MEHDPLQSAAKRLLKAQAAFSRISTAEPRPGALILQTPGCERACAQCRMDCSIVYACMQSIERKYRQALAASPNALVHDGSVFSNMAGRA